MPTDNRPVDVVAFLPHTHKSQLRDLIQKVDDTSTKFLKAGRTKYVERAGTSMGSILVKKDPWYQLNGGCQRPLCYHCNNSSHGKGIKCRQESVVYTIECKVCQAQEKTSKYIGETSRSAYERFKEHFWLFRMKKQGDLTKNQSNSALYTHSLEEHGGTLQVQDWETKILSSHRTSLSRQTKEAYLISRAGVDSLLNSKNEYGANNLTELILKHGNEVAVGSHKEKRKRTPEDQPDERKQEDVRPAAPDVTEPTCHNEAIPGEVLESTQGGGKGGHTTTQVTSTAYDMSAHQETPQIPNTDGRKGAGLAPPITSTEGPGETSPPPSKRPKIERFLFCVFSFCLTSL